jgi:pimeloyl-ACP methyl ester carboxylesterase
MAEILIDGEKIHYKKSDEIEPSRPTVLLIHGAAQRIATWNYQLDLLGNHPDFNIIAPDLPGHGRSEGKGRRSVAEYKEFLVRFIQTLGLNDIIPVGHSMAGGIAMLLTIDHSGLISACVLVDTGAKMPVAEESLKTVKNNYQSFCDISPTRMYADVASDELKWEYKAGLLDTSPEVSYWDLIACNEFDIADRVGSIDVPTLIISGELDILTPVKYGEHLHEKIKGSSFHVIRGAGHFVMQEKPDEFNRLLLDFLHGCNKVLP